MDYEEMQDWLALLGLDLSSREMLILRAVLRIATQSGGFATAADIHKEIAHTEERSIARSWIYKCLASLEKQHFILADHVASPKRYIATEDTVRAAIELLIRHRSQDIESEIRTLKDSLRKTESVSPAQVANDLYDYVLGEHDGTRATTLESAQQIRALLTEKIQALPAGSIVRAIEPSLTYDVESILWDVVETALAAVKRGVKFRVLFVVAPDDYRVDTVYDAIDSYGPEAKSTILSSKIELRHILREGLTYRAIVFNDESMILIVTAMAPLSQGVFLTRDDNPLLIRDTIAKFEEYWAQGRELAKAIRELQRDG